MKRYTVYINFVGGSRTEIFDVQEEVNLDTFESVMHFKYRDGMLHVNMKHVLFIKVVEASGVEQK